MKQWLQDWQIKRLRRRKERKKRVIETMPINKEQKDAALELLEREFGFALERYTRGHE